MYRRCKGTWIERGGKGPGSWAMLHDCWVWVPMAEAKLGAKVAAHLRDVGEQEVTLTALDDLVVPGKVLPHCQYVPAVTL